MESEFGYETNIAYGGIKNEPTNRVYMCERNSPSAGFYKGTLVTPTRIQWDASHGLPDYEVKFLDGGRMTFLPQTPNAEFLGKYLPGPWDGEACDFAVEAGELVDAARSVYLYPLKGVEKWEGTVQNATIGGVKVPGVSVDSQGCGVAAKLPFGGADSLPEVVSYSGQSVDGPFSKVDTRPFAKSRLKPGCNRLILHACGFAIGGWCFEVLNGPLPDEGIGVEPLNLGFTPSQPAENVQALGYHGGKLYFQRPDGFVRRCVPDKCAETIEVVIEPGTILPGDGMSFFNVAAQGNAQLALLDNVLYVEGRAQSLFSSEYNEQGIYRCATNSLPCVPKRVVTGNVDAHAFSDMTAASGFLYWRSGGVSGMENLVVACPVGGCPPSGPVVVYSGPTGAQEDYEYSFAVTASAIYFLRANGVMLRLPLTSPDHAASSQPTSIASVPMTHEFKTGVPLKSVAFTRLMLDGTTLRWGQQFNWGSNLVGSCELPACGEVSMRPIELWYPSPVTADGTHVYGLSVNNGNNPTHWKFAK